MRRIGAMVRRAASERASASAAAGSASTAAIWLA